LLYSTFNILRALSCLAGTEARHKIAWLVGRMGFKRERRSMNYAKMKVKISL
jgi:hypothetical protein